MSWYYNRSLGDIFEATGPIKWTIDREIDLEKTLAKAGRPQVFFGPFATQADAQTFKAANPSILDRARDVAGNLNPVNDVTSAITSFTNTIVKLWIRVAEAAVGIVLLAIAANAILKQTTGIDPAGSAIGAGKKVGKATATAAVL